MNRGQAVVHQDLHPFAAPPQTEAESAGILIGGREGLVSRHYPVEQTLTEVQHPKAGHQPAVPWNTQEKERLVEIWEEMQSRTDATATATATTTATDDATATVVVPFTTAINSPFQRGFCDER